MSDPVKEAFDLIERELKQELDAKRIYPNIRKQCEEALTALAMLRTTDHQIRSFWGAALEQMKQAQDEADSAERSFRRIKIALLEHHGVYHNTYDGSHCQRCGLSENDLKSPRDQKHFLPKVRIQIDVERVPDETKHHHSMHMISTQVLDNIKGLTAQDELLDRVFKMMVEKLRRDGKL